VVFSGAGLDKASGIVLEVKNYNLKCDIYYIDPNPVNYLDNYDVKVNYIRKDAVDGLADIVNELITDFKQK